MSVKAPIISRNRSERASSKGNAGLLSKTCASLIIDHWRLAKRATRRPPTLDVRAT